MFVRRTISCFLLFSFGWESYHCRLLQERLYMFFQGILLGEYWEIVRYERSGPSLSLNTITFNLYLGWCQMMARYRGRGTAQVCSLHNDHNTDDNSIHTNTRPASLLWRWQVSRWNIFLSTPLINNIYPDHSNVMKKADTTAVVAQTP